MYQSDRLVVQPALTTQQCIDRGTRAEIFEGFLSPSGLSIYDQYYCDFQFSSPPLIYLNVVCANDTVDLNGRSIIRMCGESSFETQYVPYYVGTYTPYNLILNDTLRSLVCDQPAAPTFSNNILSLDVTLTDFLRTNPDPELLHFECMDWLLAFSLSDNRNHDAGANPLTNILSSLALAPQLLAVQLLDVFLEESITTLLTPNNSYTFVLISGELEGDVVVPVGDLIGHDANYFVLATDAYYDITNLFAYGTYNNLISLSLTDYAPPRRRKRDLPPLVKISSIDWMKAPHLFNQVGFASYYTNGLDITAGLHLGSGINLEGALPLYFTLVNDCKFSTNLDICKSWTSSESRCYSVAVCNRTRAITDILPSYRTFMQYTTSGRGPLITDQIILDAAYALDQGVDPGDVLCAETPHVLIALSIITAPNPFTSYCQASAGSNVNSVGCLSQMQNYFPPEQYCITSPGLVPTIADYLCNDAPLPYYATWDIISISVFSPYLLNTFDQNGLSIAQTPAFVYFDCLTNLVNVDIRIQRGGTTGGYFGINSLIQPMYRSNTISIVRIQHAALQRSYYQIVHCNRNLRSLYLMDVVSEVDTSVGTDLPGYVEAFVQSTAVNVTLATFITDQMVELTLLGLFENVLIQNDLTNSSVLRRLVVSNNNPMPIDFSVLDFANTFSGLQVLELSGFFVDGTQYLSDPFICGIAQCDLSGIANLQTNLSSCCNLPVMTYSECVSQYGYTTVEQAMVCDPLYQTPTLDSSTCRILVERTYTLEHLLGTTQAQTVDADYCTSAYPDGWAVICQGTATTSSINLLQIPFCDVNSDSYIYDYAAPQPYSGPHSSADYIGAFSPSAVMGHFGVDLCETSPATSSVDIVAIQAIIDVMSTEQTFERFDCMRNLVIFIGNYKLYDIPSNQSTYARPNLFAQMMAAPYLQALVLSNVISDQPLSVLYNNVFTFFQVTLYYTNQVDPNIDIDRLISQNCNYFLMFGTSDTFFNLTNLFSTHSSYPQLMHINLGGVRDAPENTTDILDLPWSKAPNLFGIRAGDRYSRGSVLPGIFIDYKAGLYGVLPMIFYSITQCVIEQNNVCSFLPNVQTTCGVPACDPCVAAARMLPRAGDEFLVIDPLLKDNIVYDPLVALNAGCVLDGYTCQDGPKALIATSIITYWDYSYCSYSPSLTENVLGCIDDVSNFIDNICYYGPSYVSSSVYDIVCAYSYVPLLNHTEWIITSISIANPDLAQFSPLGSALPSISNVSCLPYFVSFSFTGTPTNNGDLPLIDFLIQPISESSTLNLISLTNSYMNTSYAALLVSNLTYLSLVGTAAGNGISVGVSAPSNVENFTPSTTASILLSEVLTPSMFNLNLVITETVNIDDVFSGTYSNMNSLTIYNSAQVGTVNFDLNQLSTAFPNLVTLQLTGFQNTGSMPADARICALNCFFQDVRNLCNSFAYYCCGLPNC